MSEVKYPCVFGLGDCSVMVRLIEDAKEVQALVSVIKSEKVSPELQEFLKSMAKNLSRVLSIGSVGYFCRACIELKRLRGELREL